MSDDRVEADSIFGTNSVDEIIRSNDASMSIAILVDQARRIADATIHDMLETTQRRNFKVTLGNLLHALLDYASRDVLPNACSGLRYTAAVICGAHNENRLTPVARVWIDGMLRPIKFARASNRPYYPIPSYDQTPPDLSETALMVQPCSRTHSFRDKLLIRQDYRCAVNHNQVDRECVKASWTTFKKDDRGRVRLRPSHIIPLSLGQLFEADEKELKPAVTWSLLKHWTSNNIKQLIIDGIDNPSNGLLMDPSHHEQFESFYLHFLPVADQPNTYTAHTVGSTCKYPLVTFHPRGGVAVPSPKLLAIHAALAEVFHASGFGDYFDEIWDDNEEIAVMAEDGSTNIQALTYSLQMMAAQ